VIAVLGAHGPSREVGTEHVEVDVLEHKAQASGRVVELETAPDEDAAVPLARVLVVVNAAHPRVGPEAAARLRAAAPAGVTVADLVHTSAASLAASTPEILVCVGTAEIAAAPSPLTRVGLVLFADVPEPARGLADVVWRVPEGAALDWSDLAGALAGLVAPRAERPEPPR